MRLCSILYCEFRFKGQIPAASPEVAIICPKLTGYNPIPPPTPLGPCGGGSKRIMQKYLFVSEKSLKNPIYYYCITITGATRIEVDLLPLTSE